MSNLQGVNINNLRKMVNPYRNLSYHRTEILEGIRKIAFRNMAHLTSARERCELGDDVSLDTGGIDHIQLGMLADQGLEATHVNKSLLALATFATLKLYLALLYAEVEFYNKFCRKRTILSDATLSECFDNSPEFIESLATLRHSFLHPNEATIRSERDFLDVPGSYNLAPILQRHIDEYLARTCLRLRGPLLDVFYGLPDTQRLYCNYHFSRTSYQRMGDYCDSEGMQSVVEQARAISERLPERPDDPNSWPLSPRERDSALFLAECMDLVNPSAPEQQFKDLEARQTPMPVSLLLPLLSSKRAPEFYGHSRSARHVGRNIEPIRNLLSTAGVLMNEFLTYLGKFTIEKIDEMKRTMSLREFADSYFGEFLQQSPQQRTDVASLSRAHTALLYEPLRLYRDIVQRDDAVSDPMLDKLATQERFSNLRVFRNFVFHVLDPQEDPLRVDLPQSDPSFFFDEGENLPLYFGLAGFYGIAEQKHKPRASEEGTIKV